MLIIFHTYMYAFRLLLISWNLYSCSQFEVFIIFILNNTYENNTYDNNTYDNNTYDNNAYDNNTYDNNTFDVVDFASA